MRETFGSVWATQYGAVPNDTWLRAMAEITDQELVHGLNRMIRQQMEFPPNLTQFLDLCRGEEKTEYAPYHKLLPSDPPETEEHWEARKQRAESWIEKMRRREA